MATKKQPAGQPNHVLSRHTVAYLAPEAVIDPTAMGLWSGIESAVRELDLNLIAFPGGNIRLVPDPTGGRGQANIIYELVGPPVIDGIITWASALHTSTTLEESLTEEQLQALHDRYKPLPTVTMTKAVPGYPVVIVENQQGVREAMMHLVEVHNRRRIAFIRGPERHPAASARYHGYLDTLTELGLPQNPDLISTSEDWSRDHGVHAIEQFLDQRKLRVGQDIDAIIAASDLFAMPAMEELQNRGIRIPEDIALVGFNNSAAARCATPSLTSVTVPLVDQGRKATEVLKRLLHQEKVSEKTIVPSRLATHQSCGCIDESVILAGSITEDRSADSVGNVLKIHREALLRDIHQAAAPLDLADASWAEKLLDAFVKEIEEAHQGEFLITLRETLRRAPSNSRNNLTWQNVLSAIQRHATCCQRRSDILRLLSQARTMLSEIAMRAHTDQQLQAEAHTQRLHTIGATLITTFDLQGLADVLATELPRLDIPSCYLALYENPQPYCYPQPAPEWSRLILAYNEKGRIFLDDTGQRFPTRELLPSGVLPKHRRFSMVLQALHFHSYQIGFMLFEVGPTNWSLYNILRGEISSALQGALLVQRVRERSAELTRQQYILDTFMANVPDRIYFKDLAGRITRANMAHARKMGLSDPSEEIGKSDFDFFPKEQAEIKATQEQKIIRTGKPLLAEEEIDGEGFWALSTKMALRDEKGDIIGTFGISRDITELKQAQQALEQAYGEIVHLNEQLTDENIQMRAEMDLARRIQMALVPHETRNIHSDFEIAATMLPAEEVGGDYYDIVFDRDSHLWFGIGDVAGHGITPGLIMMMAQTVHTAITTHYAVNPADIVVMVNNILLKNVQGRLNADHFMTFTTLKYLGDGEFLYAGSHLDLVIYRPQRRACELIATEGIFLNLIQDIAKETRNAKFSLDVGDILILYTDGLIEAWNENKEEFGQERFMALIQRHAHQGVAALRDVIIQEALAWCNQVQEDDMTLVIIKRLQ